MGSPKSGGTSSRRSIAYLGAFGTIQLHLRSPYIVAAWSIAFPGMGHILLSKYIRGFVLFIWEVIINYNAHVNLLIFYTFLGDFEKAKQVVDIQWLSLYIPTYIFAIWDSYQATVDLNNIYILAAREDTEIKPFKICSLGINGFDKRKPWVSVMWSLMAPGAGQLYIQRLFSSFFLITWWIIICYNSKFLPSFHYTLLGDFQRAKSVVDIQWLLNIPSVYFFAMYDAYSNTVESNKLFEWEQSKFLKKEYQHVNFKMPLKKLARGDGMYIISTFEHSIYLELAITAIQMKGIKKEDIMAVSMDKKGEERNLFDSIHSSDGLSLFDLPAILAAVFGIFGGIYGFVLKWGPLLWGLIAIFCGFIIGLIIKLILTKKYNNRQRDKKGTEVVLIIQCMENQLETVKEILWKHMALGVSKLDLDNN